MDGFLWGNRFAQIQSVKNYSTRMIVKLSYGYFYKLAQVGARSIY